MHRQVTHSLLPLAQSVNKTSAKQIRKLRVSKPTNTCTHTHTHRQIRDLHNWFVVHQCLVQLGMHTHALLRQWKWHRLLSLRLHYSHGTCGSVCKSFSTRPSRERSRVFHFVHINAKFYSQSDKFSVHLKVKMPVFVRIRCFDKLFNAVLNSLVMYSIDSMVHPPF